MRKREGRLKRVRRQEQKLDENGKIIIQPGWDRLTQEACRALNAGMTYGKWKAREARALRGKQAGRIANSIGETDDVLGEANDRVSRSAEHE